MVGARCIPGFRNRAAPIHSDSVVRQTNKPPSKDGFDLVADNRKARHDFFIEEEVEAGLMLLGTEVKSLRGHRVNLRDSYARISKKGEM